MMKTFFAILSLTLAVGLAMSAAGAEGKVKKSKAKLRHVVAFKFKDGTAKEDIKKVEDAFRDLRSR